MTRIWLATAGLGGMVSVIAGALAAHSVQDPKTAELLRTGSLYGMVHAVALVALIALIVRSGDGRAVPQGAMFVAGWSFALGIVLFSGSLFGMAATGVRWLGWATPFGGLLLIVGWAALGWVALRG